jgi:hypothetical protein
MIEPTPNAHHLYPQHPYPHKPPQHPHHQNPNTITLGCSITYGSFLPPNYAWPHIAATTTNTKINNLANPGDNLASQIQQLAQHTQQHGTPQNIWTLAPEQHRTHTLIWQTPNKTQHTYLNWDQHTHTYTINNPKNHHTPYQHKPAPGTQKPLHKPHPIHPEQATTKTLDHLYLLQWWTQTHNIQHLITSWDQTTRNTLTNIQQINPHHPQHPQQTPLTKWSDANLTPFHPPHCTHTPQTPQQQQHWDVATDNRHPGLHTQIHIAEHFTQQTITNQQLQQLG